jgi:hypothetical protein
MINPKIIKLFQFAPGDHVGCGVEPACQRGYDTLRSRNSWPQAALTVRLQVKPRRGEEKQ